MLLGPLLPCGLPGERASLPRGLGQPAHPARSGSPLPGKPPGAPAFPPPCDAGLTLSPLSVPPLRLRRTRSPGRTPGPADGATESSWAASPSARSCLPPPAPLSLCQPEWGFSSPQNPLRVPGCVVQLQVLGSEPWLGLDGTGASVTLPDPHWPVPGAQVTWGLAEQGPAEDRAGPAGQCGCQAPRTAGPPPAPSRPLKVAWLHLGLHRS